MSNVRNMLGVHWRYRNANLDALYVASAVAAGVEYSLTQKPRPIPNATELLPLYRILDQLQLPRILICTPVQSLGAPYDS